MGADSTQMMHGFFGGRIRRIAGSGESLKIHVMHRPSSCYECSSFVCMAGMMGG